MRRKECYQGQLLRNANFDDEGKNAEFSKVNLKESERQCRVYKYIYEVVPVN